MRQSVRLVLCLGVGIACSEERPAPKNPVPPVTPTAPARTVTVGWGPADAAAPVALANPNGTMGKALGVEWLRDGTLVVTTDKEVLTIEPAGTMHRAPLAGRMVKVESEAQGESIVLEGTSEAVLYDGALKEIWKGAATPFGRPNDALLLKGAGAGEVLWFQTGQLLRFALPAGGKSKQPTAVALVANGKSALVTWTVEESIEEGGTLYEVATGKVIGSAVGMGPYAIRPVATISGKTQYGFEGSTLKVIDLETAALLRSTKLACPKDTFVGNPMLSPGGDLLLVTCGNDGIALDPKTFAQRRRYTKILPGCDNGEHLPAHFDPKKPELVLEGCGGIARMELATGKYICSDDGGLVGAPYEMISPPMVNGQPRPPVPNRGIPAGRENLPKCTKDLGTTMRPTSLGPGGVLSITYDDNGKVVVMHGARKIGVDDGASMFVVSADGTKLAYLASRDRVVIRSLPSGDLVRELAPR